jgi:hypothetical protein
MIKRLTFIFASLIILVFLTVFAVSVYRPKQKETGFEQHGLRHEFTLREPLPEAEIGRFSRVVYERTPAKTEVREGEELEEIPETNQPPNFSGDRQEFYSFIAPYAIKLWREHKILPSVTIAQTAIETGYGKFTIGWNLGGEYACCQKEELLPDTLLTYKIHDYTAVAGECPYHGGRYKTLLSTNEWDNGGMGTNLVRVQRWFSYYRSIDEFLERRYKLFTMPIYSGIIGETDYVKAAGHLTYYAKAEVYIPAVISEIENNNLYEWDKIAFGEERILSENTVD